MLGFEIVKKSQPDNNFDWALLRLNGIELMLNMVSESHNRPAALDPARVTAHGGTSLFFGCRDLDAVYEHLRARGIDVKEPILRDYGMQQLSLKDPRRLPHLLSVASGLTWQ